MSGATIAELAASRNVPEKLMRQFVADFEARGVVEAVDGERWRLTPEWATFFEFIRVKDTVPLTTEDEEHLYTFCKPGPPKVAA